MLSDHAWQLKYTPEDGDLVKLFYIPALEDAERYDRLTGYFNAGALALAARGIEGLVRNGGRMRLVVGCTLDPPEIEAIERGEALREQIEKHLTTLPLAPPDAGAADALELLAWMVARGHLDVKVAVPCNPEGKPVHDSAIFHEKTGIVEDRAGNRIAWTGSLNETAAGWRRNWESISVYTSWGPEPERVDGEERSFTRLWANRSTRVIVLDVPEAARRDLMRFMPDDVPARLEASGAGQADQAEGASTRLDPTPEPSPPPPAAPPAIDRRTLVWTFIREAPRLAQGGARVGVSHRRGDPVAPSGARVRTALRALAAEAPHRGRGRTRQDHPGRHAAAPGVALRKGEADLDPRAQGGPRTVADRASREVQSQLANLRRAEARPVSLAGASREP